MNQMRLPYHKKVSFRLMRSTVGFAFLFGVALSLVVLIFGYFDQRDLARANVLGLLATSADQARVAFEADSAETAETVVEGLARHYMIQSVTLVDASGRELARANSSSSMGSEWIAAFVSEGSRTVRLELPGAGTMVATIDVAAALSFFDKQIIYAGTFGLAALLGLAGIIISVFSRVIEHPLVELIETFQRIDGRSPDQARLPVIAGHEHDELGILSGAVNQYLKASRDFLAERRWAEETLKERERRLQSVAENIPGVVFQYIRSPDGRFAYTYLSGGITDFHDLDPEKVVSERRDLLEIVHPDDREQYVAALNDSARRLTPLNCEIRQVTPSGDVIWVNAISRPYRTDTGVVVWDGVALDVTERKQAQERIHYLAQYDPLTGLLNRMWFQEHLRRALEICKRNQEQLAVLFLDLDGFKGVNDNLGHDVGDLLLKAVADRLKARMRKSDTVTRYGSAMVSRLGGDEFTVILNNLKKVDGAATAAQRIIEALTAPFHIKGNEIRTGTSIGIALYPSDGTTAEALLKSADVAMYKSKADKVNKYHFYVPEMDADVLARKQLEAELRIALDQGQLWLAYQPQVEVESVRIVGAEALIRWNHPQRGAMSPVDFIPTAEGTNLIIPIGEWAFGEACRQNKAWQDMGLPPVAVAVNVSAVQIEYQDVRAMIEKALNESGLDPKYICVEVTESVVIRHRKSALQTLHGLRELGIKVYLDDFGTGYSSLSYLRNFPIDNLKMDRAFIKDVAVNKDDAAIAQAIIKMAHSLKLEVTAEGVETQSQFDFLRSHGCNKIQGHFFSRAIPADEFEKRLREQAVDADRSLRSTG